MINFVTFVCHVEVYMLFSIYLIQFFIIIHIKFIRTKISRKVLTV